METVAARSEKAKTNSSILLWLGIFLLVACVIMLIWLISNGVYEPGMPEVTICMTMPAFFIFGGGLASVSEAVKQRRRHDATPVKLIVYDGRMLIFDDGYSCLPSDVIDVECETAPITAHSLMRWLTSASSRCIPKTKRIVIATLRTCAALT